MSILCFVPAWQRLVVWSVPFLVTAKFLCLGWFPCLDLSSRAVESRSSQSSLVSAAMTRWRFHKMHGLGNDFVVLDAVRQRIELTPELARAIADICFGIGCDQILIVEPPPSAEVDFGYRIFNADGGEVEQCGNGARCFARFVHEVGLSGKTLLRVATRAGVIELERRDDGAVTVDMGAPRFAPAVIPFRPDLACPAAWPEIEPLLASSATPAVYPFDLPGGERLAVSVLSMGNPHAVLVVGDVDTAPVETLGPALQGHPAFPASVNVGFMQVLHPQRIRLRVYERGAGETLACGTGACAAVVAGIRRGLLTSPVTVATRGGTLEVAWQEGASVRMTGPAVTVFVGEFDPEALLPRPKWPEEPAAATSSVTTPNPAKPR